MATATTPLALSAMTFKYWHMQNIAIGFTQN